MGGAGLTEGSSTVGLMLWPGKNGDLIITGVKVSSRVVLSAQLIGVIDYLSELSVSNLSGLSANYEAAR